MAERPLTVQDVCDHIAYLEYTCARLRRELAEAIKRAEKAETDLRQYMAAAQKLCEIFFDIAAKHEPEPSIRRQVDSAVQAAKEKT